jgi:DNA repair protein RadA/Sms
MAKPKKIFICNSCGSSYQKWQGQCVDCLEWNSIEEEAQQLSNSLSQSNIISSGNPLTLEDLSGDIYETSRIITPISELNRVLGGGLVEGSAILIGGDPGIGKSTLLLQLAATLSQHGTKTLYVTGEESTNQVKLRATRLGIKDSKTKIITAGNVGDIISTINLNKDEIDLVVIDSIQTMFVSEISSSPGTTSQVKASAHELINYAKQNNIILLIVGHVTKEGQIAGPKLLEHMVDTVLYFEGDNTHQFRILRSMKNRFGGVNEIGVFEMRGHGLVEITNPSELFLMERDNNVPGTSIFAGIEGTRPILVEIQALICPSNMPTPRRAVVGWDQNRLAMILAVLSVRFGLNLSTYEVYLTVAGGLKITEPAVDLAVAASIISAAKNIPLPDKSIFFGEIGLSGEVRKVSHTEQRLKEAKKLGFNKAFCNIGKEEIHNMQVNKTVHVRQVIV